MSRSIQQIVAEIDAWAVGGADELDRLDALAVEYFAHPLAADRVDAWFRLYERNPDYDSHGVFWSILHGLETLPPCEAAVVASVRRRPSEFPVMMISRMLNGDIRTVGESDLLDLLTAVAGDATVSPNVRGDAERYLKHQRDRSSS